MTSTAISVAGDKKYIAAIRALAVRRGDTIAALVRKALDAAYGTELQPILSFFESDETSVSQRGARASKKVSVHE